jgi:predicted DNA-binding transcriptional regulator AlpA
MGLDTAAAYVGLSRNSLLREVDEGRAPAPVWLTPGRKVWYKEDLDAWLDGRAGKIAPSSANDPVMEAVRGIGADEKRRPRARP